MESIEFIEDEETALKIAFKNARDKGVLFNLNKWKEERENLRIKSKREIKSLSHIHTITDNIKR